MKTFNSIEELIPYYNKKTNTYEFVENGMLIDIEFTFDLDVHSHIYADDIKARNINAWDINAWDINAWDIKAWDIDAWDIKARHIKARNINAWDINAWDIKAKDISYHAVCFAYENITCASIIGRRDNAKHFVLDGEITIEEELK